MQNKREVGAEYESRAAAWMEQKGFQILDRNFRCRFGEIDLIARKNGCIHFVEVKYRGHSRYGDGAQAVDRKKQKRISNTASYYLYHFRFATDTPCCFDVISVSPKEIRYIENAFAYTGNFN